MRHIHFVKNFFSFFSPLLEKICETQDDGRKLIIKTRSEKIFKLKIKLKGNFIAWILQRMS